MLYTVIVHIRAIQIRVGNTLNKNSRNLNCGNCIITKVNISSKCEVNCHVVTSESLEIFSQICHYRNNISFDKKDYLPIRIWFESIF